MRQWVLTLPYRLRYRLAWDHGVTRAVLAVYARVLLDSYRRGVQERGVHDGRTGTLTVIQRFGSGLNLNLNVHFHMLALDGAIGNLPQSRCRIVILVALTWIARSAILPVTEA